MDKILPPWANLIPKDSFISYAPTYEEGKFFHLFEKDNFDGKGEKKSLRYFFYDPIKHGYDPDGKYPLLLFLHGATNSLAGDLCVTYAGAECFASPKYQADMRGAYILVPMSNEYRDENGELQEDWSEDYSDSLYALVNEFIDKHTGCTGKKFVLGNSSGAAMAVTLVDKYASFFDAVIPVAGRIIPDEKILLNWARNGVYLLYAMGQHDEFHDFNTEVLPKLEAIKKNPRTFVYTPEWVQNGDKGIASINFGIEMGQHCLMNAVHSNLKFDDDTLMDERLPRGITGWIDEVNRDGSGRGRDYAPHGGFMRTGRVEVEEGVSLFYEEFGKGDKYILSAQIGFYQVGMQQRMAELGYHVYCITLRGFHPSSLVKEDFGDKWYDVFAADVLKFADAMNIKDFVYMGASHGAGVGWHLNLLKSGRVKAFVAVVAGPHSLKEGTMSYRQMIEQGIIDKVPPFNPPVEDDEGREKRRKEREEWISCSPTGFPEERKLDYGRPMMRFKTEENLCEALKTITVPTLLVGGYDDPISTPELLMRTAGCLKHCKLVMYSNCGHDIDTDLIEEVSDEADRFIRNAEETGKWYLPVSI